MRAFRKAYALGIAKCDDIETAKILHKLMGGVLEELNLHKEYSKTLGIDLDNVKPLKACKAYTDFLLKVAWNDSLPEIISAMAPCMILYAWLGKSLEKTANQNSQYIKWIKTYSSEEMQLLAKEMETLVDNLCLDNETIRENYKYAMQLELEFFEEPIRNIKQISK